MKDMTRRQKIRYLESRIAWFYYLREFFERKKKDGERMPAEAYWYGGCP